MVSYREVMLRIVQREGEKGGIVERGVTCHQSDMYAYALWVRVVQQCSRHILCGVQWWALSDSAMPHVPGVTFSYVLANMHSSLLLWCFGQKIYNSGLHVFPMFSNATSTFSPFRLSNFCPLVLTKRYMLTGKGMRHKLSIWVIFLGFRAHERWHVLPDMGRLGGKLVLLHFQGRRIPFSAESWSTPSPLQQR